MKIEVDGDVFEGLKAKAEPFVDSPNSVLRRLLGLDDGPDGSGVGALGSRSPSSGSGGVQERAAPGSILSESEYEIPILEELLQRGGSGHATEITDAVGERLEDRLTSLDRGRLNSGDIRWRNRVQFTRLTLRKLGLLKANSPRGVWELSDKGWVAAEAGEISV